MTRLLSYLLLLTGLLGGAGAHAQISYTGGDYSQDFNTLAGTTNNTLNVPWTDNVTLPGWYATKTTYNVTDGTIGGSAATFEDASSSVNNVGLFSFGAPSSADRALGSRATGAVFSGNTPINYGVRLVNNSGRTLTKFTVTYTGEQWFKSSVTTAHTLNLDYKLGATSLSDAGTWITPATGIFSSPVIAGGASTLNGNAAANRSRKTIIVTGISWGIGQELWLRFRDDNEGGSEQGLGADDFAFSADESGLYFDGATSYVTMGTGSASATAFGARSFTVECRFLKMGAGTTASTGTGGLIAVPLVAKGKSEEDATSKDANYFLGIDTNGKLCADFESYAAVGSFGAGANFPVTGSTVLENGIWYHVAATYDEATWTWKLYVNGVAEALTIPTPPISGVYPRYDSVQGLGLGMAIDSTGNSRTGSFNGILDEVRIWNFARSAADILASKDTEIISGTNGMLARFGLDEAAGTTVAGTNAIGGATPFGTLSGTTLPLWVSAKYMAPPVSTSQPPVITQTGPIPDAANISSSVSLSVGIADPDGDAQTVTFYGRETTAAVAGADFSIVAIPDTQHYAENTNQLGGANMTFYNAQMQWIVDNRVARNIAFVSHMGDIVQNANLESEWLSADGAMKKIENQAATLQAYGIPWGGAPGNHDQFPSGDVTGSTSLFNQYFGAERFAGRSYYRGHYGATNNNNNYQFFSAGGLDFIVIHLEYDPRAQSSYQAVLDWANDLLETYPNRRAIVTSHYTVNTGNPGSFSTQGQNVYNALKGNPNLFLMLGGHVSGEGRRTDTFNSSTVYSILQNYQEIANGGNGFLRVYTFSPANNLITVESYSPTLGRSVQAVDNVSGWTTTFTLPYTMQGSLTDWVPIGVANVSAGGVAASLSWTGLEPGKNYEWYAKSNDGSNNVSTGTRKFSTVVPSSPLVALTSPVAGSSTSSPATFHLAATATDADGDETISRVEFYQGSTKLGQDTTPPYEFTWSNVPGGSYSLNAVAVDSSDRATLSSSVNVTVDNTPPIVSITNPAESATFEALANYTIQAAASDSDGTVAKVEFYVNNVKAGEDAVAPFEFSVTNAISGIYTIKAKAIDNGAATTDSDSVHVIVSNAVNDLPSVSILTPANSASFVAGSTINLTASASDTDGVISKVQYYYGSALLGEAASAPYAVAWATPSFTGSYTLTAVATDNDTGVKTSTPITVVLTTAPNLIYTQLFDAMHSGEVSLPPSGWTLWNASGGSATWNASVAITPLTITNQVNVSTYPISYVSTKPVATTFSAYDALNPYPSETPTINGRMIVTNPTNSAGMAIELALQNPTGSAVPVTTLTYDTVALAFAVEELPGFSVYYSLDGRTSWTNLVGTNASYPNEGITTRSVNINANWASGVTLYIRWVDDNSNGSPDQSYGLDNVKLSTGSNVSPTVALTAPSINASYPMQATVNLAATAGTSSGTITKVEFYQGLTKLGEDTSAPFTFAWPNVVTGNYSLSAVATNSLGVSTISAQIPITVTTVANIPPVISITFPIDDAIYDAPANFTILTSASDPDGTVAKVEFFADTVKLGESTTAPFSFSVVNAFTSMSPFITAKATDNFGGTMLSSMVEVFIKNDDNAAPTVMLTLPTSGAQFITGSTALLTATAADTDGTISKVEFYYESTATPGTWTLLGEDTTAPFTFSWVTPPMIGTYSVTAVAIDNDYGIASNGLGRTSSTPVSISLISAPPLVYTQDFNAMGPSGTALPTGWSMWRSTIGAGASWKNSIPISGPVPSNSALPSVSEMAAAGALTAVTTPSGTSTSGFNAAKPGNTMNRMVATAPTGTAGVGIQLELTNSSATAINGLAVNYVIQTFTSTTVDELPGYQLFYKFGTGHSGAWINVASLNPTTATIPLTPTGTGSTAVQGMFSLSRAWAVGETLMLCWVDDNADGVLDQIYGLDDVAISSVIGAVPSCTLTSPVGGTTFTVPVTINLAATASDSDGTIAKVEFYQDGTKLGEDTTVPYGLTWTSASQGTYSLSAVAIDNTGNYGFSSPVTVYVSAGPSGTLTRGPYLQMASNNRMTVRWRSSGNVAGRVRYGTSINDLSSSVSEGSSTTEHEVALTGLATATTYYYSVGSSSDTLASGATFKFTTSPAPGTAVNTRIWVLGDAGTKNDNARSVRNTFYNWTGARDPNLVLELGDNAYDSGTDSEFQAAVFDMYPTMLRKVPFWSCLGNHETGQSGAFVDTYPYFNVYTFPKAAECGGVASGTEHYFSWDYGNIHFISLDSMTADRAANGAMGTWLASDLASNTGTWTIAFFHHPPYSRGSHNSDNSGEVQMTQMRTNILPILEAGGVDLVLSGHSHSYERSYLLDGHYGLSNTLTNAMKKNGGSGRPTNAEGAGAYMKPLTGIREHYGAVYAVPGSSGQISGVSSHPAHYYSLNELGSLVLDIDGNRLDATLVKPGTTTTTDTFTIIKQGDADFDGDGMSDVYEVANGLNPRSAADAALDSDGDGLTNLQEFRAGTAANDATDKPRVSAITPQSDGTVTLQIPTVSGKSYRVEANNSFPTGNWSIVADYISGTGALVPVPDVNAVGITTRIYRVTVLP